MATKKKTKINKKVNNTLTAEEKAELAKQKKNEKELKKLFEGEGTNANKNGQKKLTKKEKALYLLSTGLYMTYRAIGVDAVKRLLPLFKFNASDADVQHLIEDREKNGRQFKTRKPKVKVYNRTDENGNQIKVKKEYERHTPVSICAHLISFMTPKGMGKIDVQELVDSFLFQFDSRCRHLVYGYYEHTDKHIHWIYILIFTRPVLSQPLSEVQRWGSDYYWNSETKRRASKKEYKADKTGNIQLRYKKGQPMLDADGNVKKKTIHVSSHEVRMFRYSPGTRRGSQLTGFEILMERLKGALLLALCKQDDTLDSRRSFIARLPFKKGKYSDSTMIKVRDRNRVIGLVNKNLARIQKSIDAAELNGCTDVMQLWDAFKRELSRLCHADSFRLCGVEYQMNYSGHFEEFRERLQALVSLIEKKFHAFYVRYAKMMYKYGLGSREQIIMAKRDSYELNPNRQRSAYHDRMACNIARGSHISDLAPADAKPEHSDLDWDALLSNLYGRPVHAA